MLQILAKAEMLNPGGSVKDRVALQIVQEAIAEGRLRPGGLITEGTAGDSLLCKGFASSLGTEVNAARHASIRLCMHCLRTYTCPLITGGYGRCLAYGACCKWLRCSITMSEDAPIEKSQLWKRCV